MAEELESIRSLREARAAAAAARRAQAAAGPPSREAAEAAQRAAGAPSAAQARAAQARAGNYVNSRDLLMDQGQSRWNAAVNEDATRIPPRPTAQTPTPSARSAMGVVSEAEGLGPRASRALRDAASAASNAGPAIKAGVRQLPVVGNVASLALSPDAGRGSSLTSNPDAQRFLAEDQAARRARQPRAPGGAPGVNAPADVPLPQSPRSAPPRVAAPEGAPVPRQPGSAPGRPPGPVESAMPGAGSDQFSDRNPNAAGSTLRQLQEVVVKSNRDRQARRPDTRMSPRSMSADDLNEISLATAQRRGGAEMEPSRSGDIARRIMAREGEQDRQREMEGMKRGGPVKKMAKGGVVKSSASGRSDGCAVKGKTKGRMV